MRNFRRLFIASAFLISVGEAHAKMSCEIQAQKSSPVTFQPYHSSLFERVANRWNSRKTVQETTDLTGNLTNDALNRVDRIEIHYHPRGAGMPEVEVYAPEELKVREGRIIHLQFKMDKELGAMNSPLIKSITGVRFENQVREEFETWPLAQSTQLNIGDSIAVLFHRSLPRDPEYKLRLRPNGAYLTGHVLQIAEGHEDVHVLLVDQQRRLYRFPLMSVAEFRKPELPAIHPTEVARETLMNFGKEWGGARGPVRHLNRDQAVDALRHYRGRTNAAILVTALPRVGSAVIAINPVDRMDIVFGQDSMNLPWLGLHIPFTMIQGYADDDTNGL